MEFESEISGKNLTTKHFYINQLQKIFFDKRTNITMYKTVYKQLLATFGIDNSTAEIVDMIKNLYNERISQETFNMEIKYLLSIWVLIFIIGVISNIYVITVLSKVRQKIVYEIFCIGLAVTDLSILVFAVPITTLHYAMSGWRFGVFICKTVNFVVYVAVFSSTMMLLILTITRFMAVVFPWENRSFSTQKAKIACYIIWLLGAAFSCPVFIYFNVSADSNLQESFNSSSQPDPENQRCSDQFTNELARKVYFVLIFVTTYALPFKSMIIMNTMIVYRLRREFGQKKQLNSNMSNSKVTSTFINKPQTSLRENEKRQRRSRVTKIVILVTMLYGICWLPTQVVNIWYYMNPENFPTTRGMQYTKFITQALSFASACINPIVYSIMSDTFKKTEEKMCSCCFSHPEISQTETHNCHTKKDEIKLNVVFENKRCSETVIDTL